jgi:hypothetical protein
MEIVFECVFIICLCFSVGGIVVCCEEGVREVMMYEGKKSFRIVKGILLNQ